MLRLCLICCMTEKSAPWVTLWFADNRLDFCVGHSSKPRGVKAAIKAGHPCQMEAALPKAL